MENAGIFVTTGFRNPDSESHNPVRSTESRREARRTPLASPTCRNWCNIRSAASDVAVARCAAFRVGARPLWRITAERRHAERFFPRAISPKNGIWLSGWYFSPAFSSVLGKCGWLGESGNAVSQG